MSNFAPMSTLPNIRELETAELATWMSEHGEKPFRAKQVMEWLWKNSAADFESMQNLSKSLRTLLESHFVIQKVQISHQQKSDDGTAKYALRLHDGNEVEGVLIPTSTRVTACISSQIGCSLACKFCATGFLDLKRNLTFWEIYDEVDLLNQESLKEFGIPLSNIVYMGMGEPLLNYRNMWKSIEWITSPEGMGMSPRRITVSTAGIGKMIKKLGDDGARFEFALSLHAANDEKRNQIMAINESNSIDTLAEALNYFYEKTGSRVTFEYIVFKDFNDTIQDANELIDFCRRVPSKVNIIEYNPISEAGYRNTTAERMNKFREHLERNGVIVNVRRSRGRDIDGACGQLALKKR
jgi:23S rRNA (adenine2503-C2)-methyltransferase